MLRGTLRADDVFETVMIQKGWISSPYIRLGYSNHCDARGGRGMFHPFFDCDTTPLREVILMCEGLVKDFDCANMYIFQSSPWKWIVASFSRHSWKEYCSMLGFNEEYLDEGYVWHSKRKGCAVLRITQKYGIVPKLVYMVRGRAQECKKCKDLFISILNHYREAQKET